MKIILFFCIRVGILVKMIGFGGREVLEKNFVY